MTDILPRLRGLAVRIHLQGIEYARDLLRFIDDRAVLKGHQEIP